MSNNCDLDFKENCMTRTPSSCVDYEGKMSQCSELTDECKRYSVHETIGDINKQLTTICQDLDMSGVDTGCVVFEGEELRLRDVLDKVIQKLCETKEGDCELIMNTPIDCANLDYGCLVDECGDAIVPSNLKELLQSLINQSCESQVDTTYTFTENDCGGMTVVDNRTGTEVFNSCDCNDPESELISAFLESYARVPSRLNTLECFKDKIIATGDCSAMVRGKGFLKGYVRNPSLVNDLISEFNNGLEVPVNLSLCLN